MKLGAQFYSIRTECETPEGLKNSFAKIRDIGYEAVQISGCCKIEAERLKSFSDEYALPISSTHNPFEEITENTDALIEYHKTIACPVIGLGGMPTVYRASLEGIRAFIEATSEPIKKIRAAGLSFAYHNHAFEFDDLGGTCAYDMLLEEAPDMDFIHDVYWSRYAGVDTMKYLTLLCREGRMHDIHFKDMKSEPRGAICHCGGGITDFIPLIRVCNEYGIATAQVEQDNAPDFGDAFAEMKASFDYLFPLIKENRK